MDEHAIAVEVINHLWPKGTWPEGAKATRIHPKTFGRIAKGGPIKDENWRKLKGTREFAAEFAKRMRAAAPTITAGEREAIGRLSRAFGPRDLKSAVFELETLVSLVGPKRALRLLELQAESASEVLDSAEESTDGQKTVD